MSFGAGAVKVLLVEDNPGDAVLLTRSLAETTNPRFMVTRAASLTEGIAKLRTGPFDVVLLDLSLPDSHGVGTVIELQRAAPDMPIVVMTGLDDPVVAAQALEAGAQDYLVKGDDGAQVVSRTVRYAITRMAGQVERRHLLERLAEDQARVRAELAVARSMQFDLLPRHSRMAPQFAQMGISMESHFRPCSGIGGDLWGLLDAGPGRLCLFSFDFSGHGIGAALNVFRLHALIRDVGVVTDPASLLTHLNSVLRPMLGRGQFATMFIGILDADTDDLTFSGCGTPPPVLVEPDGTRRMLVTRGLPLGVADSPAYANHTAVFAPGTSLFVYSDALVEAQTRDGEFFGESRLDALVADAWRQPKPLEALMRNFDARVRLPVEDDVTAVWLTRGRSL